MRSGITINITIDAPAICHRGGGGGGGGGVRNERETKDKNDKEALLTSRFETDNISSVELLLRHNKYKQIPTCVLVSS